MMVCACPCRGWCHQLTMSKSRYCRRSALRCSQRRCDRSRLPEHNSRTRPCSGAWASRQRRQTASACSTSLRQSSLESTAARTSSGSVAAAAAGKSPLSAWSSSSRRGFRGRPHQPPSLSSTPSPNIIRKRVSACAGSIAEAALEPGCRKQWRC